WGGGGEPEEEARGGGGAGGGGGERGERPPPLGAPALGGVSPADILEREARRHELEHALLPRHLLLLGEDLEERALVEGLPRGEDLGDEMADLVGGQAAHREREPPHRGLVDREAESAVQVRVEDARDLAVVGQLVLDDVDLLLRLLGYREPGRDEQHVLSAVLRGAVEVTHPPDDVRPALGPGGKVLQQVEALAG